LVREVCAVLGSWAREDIRAWSFGGPDHNLMRTRWRSLLKRVRTYFEHIVAIFAATIARCDSLRWRLYFTPYATAAGMPHDMPAGVAITHEADVAGTGSPISPKDEVAPR